ncbi:MAG: hypothetical protein ABGX26_02910 [Nautiliaceae bacterium]
MRKLLLLSAVLGVFFIGCAGDRLTITKCKTYKDGICVAKEVKEVKKCKNPVIIAGKTYCE